MIYKLFEKYRSMSIVTRATIWFLICSIIQKGFAFITTPIFTRIMSTEQYGQYSIYLSWFQILTMVTSFRLDYAVFNKGMSKYEDDKDGYTLSMQTITTIITLIVFVVYLIFHDIVNAFTNLTTPLTILMFAQAFFMNAITFWTIKQRYNFKYRSVVIVTLLLTLLDMLLGIILVINFANKGIARIVSLAMIQIIIGCVIYVFNIIKGKRFLNLKYARFAITFNIPLLPHYLSIYILEQSDKIMIQKMSGIDKVGIYSVAYSIGNAMNIVTNSITQALTPWLYRRLKEDNLKEIKNKLLSIFMFVIAIISIFILFVPEFLSIIASEQYYEAIYVVSPVSASIFFTLVYGFFATIEFYFNKNKFSMIISGFSAVINILLNFIFISLLGYQAAGYTTMICYAILTIGHVIYTNNIVKKEKQQQICSNKYIIGLVILMFVIVIISDLLYKFALIRYLCVLIIFLIICIKRNKIKELLKIANKKI